MRRAVRIEKVRYAGVRGDGEFAVNQIVSDGSGSAVYRRTPCGGCPWVKANAGIFPAEAFRISATTSYDAAFETFACHESGLRSPATCAGFLLKNSVNNLRVRLSRSSGKLNLSEVHEDGRALFESYREMAIANGVPPDDPALAQCRGDDE